MKTQHATIIPRFKFLVENANKLTFDFLHWVDLFAKMLDDIEYCFCFTVDGCGVAIDISQIIFCEWVYVLLFIDLLNRKSKFYPLWIFHAITTLVFLRDKMIVINNLLHTSILKSLNSIKCGVAAFAFNVRFEESFACFFLTLEFFTLAKVTQCVGFFFVSFYLCW